MPWYYAGPEAKPVGPFTLEELQALRAKGTVAQETYVIEQTAQSVGALAWKRYQDVFPAMAALPPVPPPAPVATPPVFAPQPQAHPLFPSGTPVTTHAPVFPPGARPDPYYQGKATNSWCVWGFWLGLIAFFLAFACGVGLVPALIAIPLCIIGLVGVVRHPGQKGKGYAISGLALSLVALLVVFLWAAYWAMPFLKAHGLTVTEQTTNDSE